MSVRVSVEKQLALDCHHALVQAAIAEFLFQQRRNNPAVVRHHLDVLFRCESCTL